MAARFRNLDIRDHELTDEEIRLTGTVHPRLNPVAFRNQFRWSLLGKNIQVAEPCSYTFRTCTKPLSSLKRTSISEQVVNIPSLGKYLLLRTLERPVSAANTPVFGTTTVVLVEDHNKDVTICSLFGYIISHFDKTSEELLPVDTVFVLKEPLLKPCNDDSFALVVGSPSDFVIIGRSHALARDLELLGWREKLSDVKGTRQVSELVLEWKSMGNEHYKQQMYQEAIEFYRLALNSAEEEEIKLVLHLNLAGTYLLLEYFELAVKEAREVLKVEPRNEKALYRAGRGHYELRQYKEARGFFQDVLTVNPSNRKALSEKTHCEARLKEELGQIDVYRLHREARQSTLLSLDCGNYVGPVKFVNSTITSRGAYATVGINPGTLILTEKSFAYTVNNYEIRDAAFEKYVTDIIALVLKNPNTFGRQIISLRAGKPLIDENQEIFCDAKNQSEVIVNHFRIIRILSTYVLSEDYNTSNPSVWQLFLLASCFRHSCVSNCTFAIYNNVITIQTCKMVKKGEQLTIPYLSSLAIHYPIKVHLLDNLRMSCDCFLCKLDGKDKDDVHQNRKSIRDQVVPLQNLLMPYGAMVQMYSDLVKKMESTYSKRPKLRVHLSGIYFYLAKAIMLSGENLWEDNFTRYIDKALKCFGLTLDVLVKSAEDDNISLPQNAIVTKEFFDFIVLIFEKEYESGRLEDVAKWAKVLTFWERILTRGNFQMLKDRLVNKSDLFPVIEELIK